MPSEGVASVCQRGLELEDGTVGYRAGEVSCGRGRLGRWLLPRSPDLRSSDVCSALQVSESPDLLSY